MMILLMLISGCVLKRNNFLFLHAKSSLFSE